MNAAELTQGDETPDGPVRWGAETAPLSPRLFVTLEEAERWAREALVPAHGAARVAELPPRGS